MSFEPVPTLDGRSSRSPRRGAAHSAVEWKHAHLLTVLVSLVLVGYARALGGSFVFDDVQHVQTHPVVRDLASLFTAAGYETVRLRWFGYVTFALSHALGGGAPWAHHVVNLCIHVGASTLLYALVLALFRTPRLRTSSLRERERVVAFVAALLFATHPMQTQAVSYIVQRFASLAGALGLASTVLYVRWRLVDEGSRSTAPRLARASAYAGALVCAVLAMKTKESSFTLPLALVACELAFFDLERWRPRLRRLAPFLLTMLIVPVSLFRWGGSTAAGLSAATKVQTDLSRWEYFRSELPVVATYLRLLAWPTGQSLDHDVPVAGSWLEVRVAASGLLLAALLGLALLLLRRSGRSAPPAPGAVGHDPAWALVGLGVLWFFLGLSVESTFVPIVDLLYEHRVYLPSAGLFAAAATALALGLRRVGPAAERALLPAAMALALVLTVVTFQRNAVWRDEVTLWRDAAEKAPNKPRPHANLGTALARRGAVEEGAAALTRAVELDPTSDYARAQLGAALLSLGRPAEAEPHLRAALERAPRDPEVLFNLAMLLARSGRRDESRPIFQRFLEVAPAQYAQARALAERGAR